MGISIKVHEVVPGDVISSSKILFNQYEGTSLITPLFKARDNNPTQTGAIKPSMHGSVQIDGDLILLASWTGGMGVYRVNNDGTISTLYTDSQPANSYANWNCVAMDKTDGLLWIGSYANPGIQEYTYSGVQNQGEGSVVKNETSPTYNLGVATYDSGYAYWNGL